MPPPEVLGYAYRHFAFEVTLAIISIRITQAANVEEG
jgi:hypothetical protein